MVRISSITTKISNIPRRSNIVLKEIFLHPKENSILSKETGEVLYRTPGTPIAEDIKKILVPVKEKIKSGIKELKNLI